MGHAVPVVCTPLGQWHTFCLHSRSCVPLGARDSYSCDAHSAACVAHVRSVVRVGATFSYSPAVHTSATVHGLPSSALEKVVPSMHAAHMRSTVAEGALLWPWPGGHVAHLPQEACPVPDVKVPASQKPHVMSAEAVAEAVMCVPAGHGARTALHAEPSSTAENETPKIL